MTFNKKFLVFSSVVTAGAIFFCLVGLNSPKNIVLIGQKSFFVEVADTESLRERGLSGHKLLKENEGMLFVFKKVGDYGFWMKDMQFPIDIIWIDQNLKISHIEKNVSPETYPKILYGSGKDLYVLEILGGQAEFHGFQINAEVKIF